MINNISKIIAISSVKGGVGKSTITANIAMFLRKKKNNIGILDADIYGASQEKILGIKTKSKLKKNIFIPTEINEIKIISINSLIKKKKLIMLKSLIIKKFINDLIYNVYWGDIDFLLIDLPPGTGDININIIKNIKIDYVIIISTSKEIDFDITKKSIYMFKKLNIPILGVIENFSDIFCNECEKKIIKNNYNLAKKLNKYKIKIIEKIPLFEDISKINIISTNYKNININILFNKISEVIINNFFCNKYYYILKNGIFFIIFNKKKIKINIYKLRLLCKCIQYSKKNPSIIFNTNIISKKIYIKKIKKINKYMLKIKFSDHINGIINNKTIYYLYKYSNIKLDFNFIK